MAVRKIKGSWWVDFRWAGERLRKRSPLNTKGGAEAYEAQLRQRLAQRGAIHDDTLNTVPAATDRAPTFAEFIPRWMRDYVAVNNKPSEQRAKQNALRNHLLPAFEPLALAEITSLRVEQFKASLLEKGLSPKSINNYLSILRKCLDTAVEWDLLPSLPRIRWLKSAVPAVTHLSSGEVNELTAAAQGTVRTMIVVAAQTGLRFCELIALRWEDLDLQGRRICVQRAEVRGHVGTTKNNRLRHVPMTNRVFEVLKSLDRTAPLVFHREGRSIRYVRALEQLKQACLRIGMRAISWHVLRHTFASELARRGVPLQSIKELLGHSSLTMTLRYAHLSPDTLQCAVSVLDQPEIVWATGGQPVRGPVALGHVSRGTARAEMDVLQPKNAADRQHILMVGVDGFEPSADCNARPIPNLQNRSVEPRHGSSPHLSLSSTTP